MFYDDWMDRQPGGPEDPDLNAKELRDMEDEKEHSERVARPDHLAGALLQHEQEWLGETLERLLGGEPKIHDQGAALVFADFVREARNRADRAIWEEIKARGRS